MLINRQIQKIDEKKVLSASRLFLTLSIKFAETGAQSFIEIESAGYKFHNLRYTILKSQYILNCSRTWRFNFQRP